MILSQVEKGLGRTVNAGCKRDSRSIKGNYLSEDWISLHGGEVSWGFVHFTKSPVSVGLQARKAPKKGLWKPSDVSLLVSGETR